MKRPRLPSGCLLAFSLLGCFTGCDDEAEVTGMPDAATDLAVTDAFTQGEAKPDVAVRDALAVATDTQTSDPDAPLAEFSWSVDPMTVQLRRGTCRELLVHVKRRPDFNDAIVFGVGNGPSRVGFASTHVAPGASAGTIILATPHNAPAVTNQPMIIAASGKATYLRITLNVTVLDTPAVSDGGVVETSADGGIWDSQTCSQTLEGLAKIAI